MANLEAKDAVATLIDSLLPRFTRDRGLYLKVAINTQHYTMVFCAKGAHDTPPMDDFKLTSNHDSVWRGDGFRTLRFAENDMRNQLLADQPAGSETSTFTRIEQVAYCTLEWEQTERNNPYMRNLTALKVLGSTADIIKREHEEER